MKPIRISHPASAEFADAVRWYEQKRAGLGGEFFDAVTDAMAIDHAPAQRSEPLLAELASWLLTRFPYRLIYRVRDEEIPRAHSPQ